MQRLTPVRWVVAVVLALIAILAMVGCGDDSTDAAATGDGRTGFTLSALEDSGTERGAGYLEQDGDRLSGWIVVWGLEPGSHHASHLHANPAGEANASCPDRQTDRHAIDFEDLVADGRGVATREVDLLVGEPIVRGGVYWMVHAHGSDGDHAGHHDHGAGGGNPGLLCGDLIPAEER